MILAYTITLPDWWVVAVAAGAAAGVVMAALAAKWIGQALVRAGHPWYIAVAIEGVGAIGLVGWVQSYISLRELALLAQEPEVEADAWPAVLDTFAIVMGVAALGARGDDRHDRHADRLAYVYSAAAISANILNALQTALAAHQTGLPLLITILVRGLAPLTMVLGFHWLMKRVRPRRADGLERAVALIVQAEELPRHVAESLFARLTPMLPDRRPEPPIVIEQADVQVVPAEAPQAALPEAPRPAPEERVEADERPSRAPRPPARGKGGAEKDPRKTRARDYWEAAVQKGTEPRLTASDLVHAAGGRPPLPDRTARRWLREWRQHRVTVFEHREVAR